MPMDRRPDGANASKRPGGDAGESVELVVAREQEQHRHHLGVVVGGESEARAMCAHRVGRDATGRVRSQRAQRPTRVRRCGVGPRANGA